MEYDLDDLDYKLIEKCRSAVEFDLNGDPMKDVLDQEDFEDVVYLLIAIIDKEQKETKQ
jgi:hypothetical protein